VQVDHLHPDGEAGQGGRVTEILARPLLEHFYPGLASISQPLAGETAIRRAALSGLNLADGYGIEIGLLIDVYRRFGIATIAEVDLGYRPHRNRLLQDLRLHSREVLHAVLSRCALPSASG
jgi:glucosyl-3-phosphoglycerate synthase